MGVDNKVLFADPLGVNGDNVDKSQLGCTAEFGSAIDIGAAGDSPAAANPRIIAPPPAGGPPKAVECSDDGGVGVAREDGESNSIMCTVGGYLWYFITGGRQCCSMRDRTADGEAARRASLTGRPPGFPPPGAAAAAPAVTAQDADLANRPSDDDERTPCGTARSRGRGGGPTHRGRSATPTGAGAMFLHPNSARGPRAFSPDDMRRSPSLASSYRALSCSAVSSAASIMPPASARSNNGGRKAASRSRAPTYAEPSAQQRGRRQAWQWPAWALRYKTPCIEVFVQDEDTGKSCWVEAEPQSSVIDPAGGDAFLAVEYSWDGEYYVQDFGPEHVRQKGSKTTVQELLRREDEGSS